jgi:hypothetical protein
MPDVKSRFKNDITLEEKWVEKNFQNFQANLFLWMIWTPAPHVPWSLHLMLAVTRSLLRKSASGDRVHSGTIASLFAPFGILMPNGEKRSSRKVKTIYVVNLIVLPYYPCNHISLLGWTFFTCN